MEDKLDLPTLQGHLEELAERLGIPVRYEAMGASTLSSAGGLCKIKSREVIIVDVNAPRAEQVGVLLDTLGELELDSIFVPPAVRNALARRRR